MISLQNLLRPSNGNKLFALFILVSVYSSCVVMRSNDVSGSKIYIPANDGEVKVIRPDTVRLDTIKWETEKKNEEVIIIEEEKSSEPEKLTKKASYKVDILIPMDSYSVIGSLEDIEQGPANSMLHYYGGMIMALVELKAKGANLDVKVYDAPPDQDRTNDYLETARKNKPDMIIGPNEKEQLKKINAFCSTNQIPLIAPWKAISNVSNANSNYIQLKPSLETYYEKMCQDIDDRYKADEVYLVGQDDGASRSRLRNINAIHKKTAVNSGDYSSVVVSQVKLESDLPLFKQIFSGAGQRKVIILPNWSFKDEDFLFACLRKINLEKSSYQVEIYGMPIMLNSEKLSYDLFRSLNIRIVSPNYLDETDVMVKQFRKDFYDQFNVFPEPEAYEGFDMMSFVGSNLIEYGKYFASNIENLDFDLQTTAYKLIKKMPGSDVAPPDEFEYFENKKLFIIGFENNKFVKLR